jgi:hypothetical protein
MVNAIVGRLLGLIRSEWAVRTLYLTSAPTIREEQDRACANASPQRASVAPRELVAPAHASVLFQSLGRASIGSRDKREDSEAIHSQSRDSDYVRADLEIL